jgi:hypothetical protein
LCSYSNAPKQNSVTKLVELPVTKIRRDMQEMPPSDDQRKLMILPEDVGELAVTIASMPPRCIIPHVTITGW